VGHADRACFDLEQHMKHSGADFQMSRKLDTPIVEQKLIEKYDKGLMGKALKKDSQLVVKYVSELSEADKLELKQKLDSSGKVSVNIEGKDMNILSTYLTFESREIKTHEVKFIPHVIEPSFGLGRIVYSILENTFFVRPDQEIVKGEPLKTYFKFPSELAPIKVGIFPLQSDEKFGPICEDIEYALKESGISCKIDATGVAIGRR